MKHLPSFSEQKLIFISNSFTNFVFVSVRYKMYNIFSFTEDLAMYLSPLDPEDFLGIKEDLFLCDIILNMDCGQI